METLPMWLLILQIYQKTMVQARAYGRRINTVLLEKLHMVGGLDFELRIGFTY